MSLVTPALSLLAPALSLLAIALSLVAPALSLFAPALSAFSFGLLDSLGLTAIALVTTESQATKCRGEIVSLFGSIAATATILGV